MKENETDELLEKQEIATAEMTTQNATETDDETAGDRPTNRAGMNDATDTTGTGITVVGTETNGETEMIGEIETIGGGRRRTETESS